ncbi:MAG: efflux RND transporter periplasmic adaptor subunit [Myxococcota bacterium]
MIDAKKLTVLWVCAVACAQPEDPISPVRRDIVEAVFATGHLEMSDEYVASTQQEGFVTDVYVKPGDEVEAGTPLFRLASPTKTSELATAHAQYSDALRKASPNSPSRRALESQIALAREQVNLETTNLKRYEALRAANATSELDYDNAKARLDSAQSNLEVLEENLADLVGELTLGVRVNKNQLDIVKSQQEDHLIRAAHAGRVLEIHKERGELARKGESLTRIGGGQLQASLYISEDDIHLIRVGQPVRFGLNTHRNRVFNGEVSKIHPAFDSDSQSFVLTASIAPSEAVLYAGTQLQANVTVSVREQGLAVPIEYVSDGHVHLEDGRLVPVTTGIQTGEWIEVMEGISDSDRLVAQR